MRKWKALLISLAHLSCAKNINNPFETHPDFGIEYFDIAPFNDKRSRLAPGYIFVSPLLPQNSWGAQIYDVDGNLVFHTGHRRVQDFKACDYLGEGENYLCWHQSRFKIGSDPFIPSTRSLTRRGQSPPRPIGEKLVFDTTYTQVGLTYTDGIYQGKTKNWPNGHEYNMLPGGESFLQAVYKPTPLDLRQYTGERDGYIMDGCFQERSVHSGDAIFEWCYCDHLELWETNLFFVSDNQRNETSPKAGRGTKRHPWDFIHLNAVDKTSEGDYLVSGRHLDQIIKVAGLENPHGLEPGDVIWRLGGKSNDFEMINDFVFTKQHDVRVISTGVNETVLSLFNNAWEGTNKPSSARSSGMIIAVNNNTMEARLLHQYLHPDGSLARAMGSMQVLPNKNVMVGWGASPQITEFSENGTVLWHAWYDRRLQHRGSLKNGRLHHAATISGPDFEEDDLQEWTYRAVKHPWTGKPTWSPKLHVYKQTCSIRDGTPLLAYISWNGATEVRSWRLYVGQGRKGPWTPLITVPKEGFETKVNLTDATEELHHQRGRLLQWYKVEALDNDGQALGSGRKRVFVPAISVRRKCNQNGCRSKDPTFRYRHKDNCVSRCKSGFDKILSALMLLLPFFIIAETLNFFGQAFCRALVYIQAHKRDGGSWRAFPSLLLNGSSAKSGLNWFPLGHRQNMLRGHNALEQQNYSDQSQGLAEKG